jgi:hypothetical protein
MPASQKSAASPLSQSFNHLLQFIIAMHARVAQKLLEMCEKVKITWSQVWTVGRKEKSPS